MAKKSKQLRAALEKIDSTKAYSVEEAVALAKETNFAKFDATVEVAFRLGVDTRKNDQQVRGAVVLPKGTNTDLMTCHTKSFDDKLLTAKNKWLIAHEEAGIEGAVCGLKGENIDIAK